MKNIAPLLGCIPWGALYHVNLWLGAIGLSAQLVGLAMLVREFILVGRQIRKLREELDAPGN